MKLMFLYGVLAVVVLSRQAVDAINPDTSNEILTYTCGTDGATKYTKITIQYGSPRSAYYRAHTTMVITSKDEDLNAASQAKRDKCTVEGLDAETVYSVPVSNSNCTLFGKGPQEEFAVRFFSNLTVQTLYPILFEFACDFSASVTVQYNTTGNVTATAIKKGTSNAQQVSGNLTLNDDGGVPVSVLSLGDSKTFTAVVAMTFGPGFASFRVNSFEATIGTQTVLLAANETKLFPGGGTLPWTDDTNDAFNTTGNVARSKPFYGFSVKLLTDAPITLKVEVELCYSVGCGIVGGTQRRKRSDFDVEDEPVKIELSYTADLVDKRIPVTSNTKEEKKGAPESRVVPCWQSTEFTAVVVVLVVLLLISISISCFSVIRARPLYVNNKPV